MYDFFINLLVDSIMILSLKIFIVIITSILLSYLFKSIWLQFIDSNIPFTIQADIIYLKSIIIVVLLLNIYLILIVKLNGVYLFTLNKFPISLNNIYFLISPYILSIIIMVLLFFKTFSKIKKQL
jgi:hypothetical protein